MVNPIGLIKVAAKQLALNNANGHLRLSLHYNCGFLRTVLRNIGFITRAFLDNHRRVTKCPLRDTRIVRTATLRDIGKVISP